MRPTTPAENHPLSLLRPPPDPAGVDSGGTLGFPRFGPSNHDEEDHGPASEAPPWPDAGEVWVIGSQDGSEYGPTQGGFTIVRGSAAGDLTVHYDPPGGTATAGVDYTGPAAGGGTVTIPGGQYVAFIPVDPVNDALFEGDETLTLTLAASGGYTVDPDYESATITIQDNDRPTGSGSVAGVAWTDGDGTPGSINGIRDPGELLMPDVRVSMWDQDHYYVADTKTDQNGAYRFVGLADGTYYVQFERGANGFTIPDEPPDDAVDSDVDPASGWAVVTVAGGGSALHTDAGFVIPVIPTCGEEDFHGDCTPPPAQMKVIITDGKGNFVTDQIDADGNSTAGPDKELKVAKLPHAFDPVRNQIGLTIDVKPRLPNADSRIDFIDRDDDRFNIRVYHPNEWGKGTPFLDATLSTANVAGFTQYDDPVTTIRLMRDTTPGWAGWYWSDSMVLVSNKADDEFSNVQIAADEAGPGWFAYYPKTIDNRGYWFPVTDRTHRVALGGTVKVECGGLTAMAPVKVKKQVTVSGHILGDANGNPMIGEVFHDKNNNGKYDAGEDWRDADGNNAYTAKLTMQQAIDRFKHDITVANEVYAQVGVWILGGQANLIVPEGAAATGVIQVSGKAITGDFNMTESEGHLVAGGHNTPNPDDIEVYYIVAFDRTTTQGYYGGRGWAFAVQHYQGMNVPDVNDSIFLPNNADFYVAAHEFYHIFSGEGKHLTSPNLMAEVPSHVMDASRTQFKDTKRLTGIQETVIYNSAYAKPPT